jgi:peptide subunit release factor 1 (eRF1)
LVIYCGTILTDDGKERRVNIDFEPFKPINTSLYLCDNKFHTEVRCRSLVRPLLHTLFPVNVTSDPLFIFVALPPAGAE